jgi:hypothetical protein
VPVGLLAALLLVGGLLVARHTTGPVSDGAAVPVAGVPELVKHTEADAPMPAACGSDGSRCLRTLTMPGGGTISAYSNFPLTGAPQVTHAIVVIHGAGGNARFYFSGMMQAAQKAGAAANTIVIAPWFKTDKNKPTGNELRWSSGGWKVGDPDESSAHTSSFSVVDSIFTTLSNKRSFPKLFWATLTGHSAGGQFTDRYASFSQVPSRLPGMLVTYVIANPSSFVYFDDQRPSGSGGGFSVPSGSCAGYNAGKYGMQGRNAYSSQVTPAQAERMFLTRRVTILNGSADTVQNGDMDASCQAMLEGPNRLARGANFAARMRQLAPAAPHDRVLVPNVAHDHLAMFDAVQARTVLFGPRPGGAASTPTASDNATSQEAQ